jgi:prophage antirepressor-like protein
MVAVSNSFARSHIPFFNHDNFGDVRVVDIEGKPWIVAKDVCKAFGDTNPKRSIRRLDPADKGVSLVATPGGPQKMTVITEPGLYDLLFNMRPNQSPKHDEKTKKRIAELDAFLHWVCHDILPSIRKHGAYIVTKPEDTEADIMARALNIAERIKAERDGLAEPESVAAFTANLEAVTAILAK